MTTDWRIAIHAVFVFALPVVVAAFGISIPGAIVLVLAALFWRWAIVLSGLARPGRKEDELVLESMSASHFVEKVRWCMDRLGVRYREQAAGGTLGAFLTGRTVPRLDFRTGMVRSRIGNSAAILRYLWGAYGESHGDAAAFLRPSAARVAFEQRLDRYGRTLQVWIYYHILHDAGLCRHVWGAGDPNVPWWQRRLVALGYPVLAFLVRRAFRPTREHYERCCHHIEEVLSEVDTNLADGRNSILGDDGINYTDITFAAMTVLWLQVPGFGGGRAEAVRLPLQRFPEPMRGDIARWSEDYPRVVAFVERLYVEERMPRQRADSDTGD